MTKTWTAGVVLGCVLGLVGCGGGGGANVRVDPPEPEVVGPEVTEPEVTEPEVTEPEVTEPEVTEPEVRGWQAPGTVSTDNTAHAQAPARAITGPGRRIEVTYRGDAPSPALKRSVRIAAEQWARHLTGGEAHRITVHVDELGQCEGVRGCGYAYALGNAIFLSEAAVQAIEHVPDRRRPDERPSGVRLLGHEIGHTLGYSCAGAPGCRTGDPHHWGDPGESLMAHPVSGRPYVVEVRSADVAHLPPGTARWDEAPARQWKVTQEAHGVPGVERFGAWLRRDFAYTVEHERAREGVYTYTERYADAYTAAGFVEGAPSPAHGLTGDARWRGRLAGVALEAVPVPLRAGAALDYTFDAEGGSMAAAFDGFEVETRPGVWTPYVRLDAADTAYALLCDAAGCGRDAGGERLGVRFYGPPEAPAAGAAGTVSDTARKYAGAFAAQRESQ